VLLDFLGKASSQKIRIVTAFYCEKLSGSMIRCLFVCVKFMRQNGNENAKEKYEVNVPLAYKRPKQHDPM